MTLNRKLVADKSSDPTEVCSSHFAGELRIGPHNLADVQCTEGLLCWWDVSKVDIFALPEVAFYSDSRLH